MYLLCWNKFDEKAVQCRFVKYDDLKVFGCTCYVETNLMRRQFNADLLAMPMNTKGLDVMTLSLGTSKYQGMFLTSMILILMLNVYNL